MKIAIIDTLGLTYDGSTLSKQGLGGSESAVIYISKELAKLGHSVSVFNNCSQDGYYDKVLYIDHNNAASELEKTYDIVISSRSVLPFMANNKYAEMCFAAKKRVLWMHDTFCEGDHDLEDMLVRGYIDEVFTLSDFHSWYFSSCDHGNKRNFETLKHKFWQTRNGAEKYPVVSEKDKNHFIYNASATKGLEPLLNNIWPLIKKAIPEARLTCVGGFYNFADNKPDDQELIVRNFQKKNLDSVTFTGVITQFEIAELLQNAYMMLYPTGFPETFGISSLEALLYNTPLVTNSFGALEETALDIACYKIPYSSTNNALFNNINEQEQAILFANTVINAYNNDYLHYQKQNACDVLEDIHSWDTVALQWDQHLHTLLDIPYDVIKYRKVTRINDKVTRIFNRRFNNIEDRRQYSDYSEERRIVVISPFYNAENYIRNHILSVAQQDYDNYLHVLIDDNSTDTSFSTAVNIIQELPVELQNKIVIEQNKSNKGAIYNQFTAFKQHVFEDDIVMLLDADDSLVSNNTIFKYYNDLYNQSYDLTYGSMLSLADDIPLVAQKYDKNVEYPWKIPYTHLRTFKGSIAISLNQYDYQKDGKWFRAGADALLFVDTLQRAKKPLAVKEIMVKYNDLNPINDYKVNTEEQTQTSDNIMTKKILIAVPTNKYVETETMKSIYDLTIPLGYTTELQFFYGYQVDQIRNLIADWGQRYDYVLNIDSDIVLPKDALVKMLNADKDIISGLYIQRKPNDHILEVYDENGNIPIENIQGRGLVQIEACGFGCCLVKQKVFTDLDYPHFKYTSAIDHSNTISEDWYFCQKAKQNGFTTWLDDSIRCEHIGDIKYSVVNNNKTHLDAVAEANLLPVEHSNYLASLDIQPKVIYDLGACVLHWTREARKIWPNANFYLVDAATSVKPYLNRSGYDYEIAVLSDIDDKDITFYEDVNNPGGNSYYKETTGAYTEKHAVKRKTTTLSSIVKNKGWSLPDLIKLDIQGAELDTLKGAEDILINCKDIILEAQHTDYNDGAPKIEEVTQYLESLGYYLVNNFTKTDVDGDYHFSRKV